MARFAQTAGSYTFLREMIENCSASYLVTDPGYMQICLQIHESPTFVWTGDFLDCHVSKEASKSVIFPCRLLSMGRWRGVGNWHCRSYLHNEISIWHRECKVLLGHFKYRCLPPGLWESGAVP